MLERVSGLMRRCGVGAVALVFLACAGAQVGTVEGADGKPAQPAASSKAERSGSAEAREKVRFTILQMNDVYEITPVEGGRRGGLARVAALRERLLEENPDTLTVLAGDFVSPSALGTARVDGERLAGRQMIDVLNVLGLDFAVIGNHELDLQKPQLLARIAESEFTWLSTNVFDAATGKRFEGIDRWAIHTVDADGERPVRVAFLGPTLTSNDADYVSYTPPLEAFRSDLAALPDDVDVVVALTHLAMPQDIEVAETFPEVDLVLGGHEHENIQVWRGPRSTPIVKADANARSVYVHRLAYDTASGELEIDSRLVLVTDRMPDDPETAKVVADWVERGFAGFRADGFAPEELVVNSTEALDGREANTRTSSTNLTRLLAAAFRAEVPGAHVGLYNSGSIRIDDVLPAGPITQYDVIRVLPFGGIVQGVEVKGSLLTRVLEAGAELHGTGGFLQYDGVEQTDSGWKVGEAAVDPEKTYLVAASDYLAAGRQSGLGFFGPDNPDLTVGQDYRDQRKVLIDELIRRFGS